MLSPASVQIFPNDKKAKKKNPNYKSSKEKDPTPSVGKNKKETISIGSKNESTEKSHFNFGDLKDFPELKVSEKNKNTFCFESSKNGLKTEKPWLTSFSDGNKKKLSEHFPALPSVSNLQKSEVNFSKEKDKSNKTILENNTSETIIKVEVNKKKNNDDPYTTKEKKVIPLAKTPVKPTRNPNKKKRTDPIFINFQDILAIKKIKKKTKQHNIHRSKIQRPKDKEFLSGNILDSSNPIRSRGKHREIKKQKLSKFKITIIKERLLKQKMREIETGSHSEYDSFNLIDKIDFNKEIKNYLDQLKEKKLKNSKSKQTETNGVISVNKINKQKQKNTDTKLLEEKEKHLENVTADFKEKQIPQTTAEGEVKFSSKFREYCDNVLTPDLNFAVTELIKGLIMLQDKLFLRDPVKARAKKRHVSGIREVKKHLTLKKAKMIIIAPNLEKLQMEGSVYDSVNELKSMAVSQNVPYGFALDRYKLGRCTKKNAPVSAFAVLNYEGIEELYEKALHQLFESKKKFSELITPKKVAVDSDNVNSKVISSLVSVFREKLQVSSETQNQILKFIKGIN